MLQLIKQKGIIQVIAKHYTLIFPADRPFVYLEDSRGRRLAELFVLSSVHSLHGRDDTLSVGDWQIAEAQDEVTLSLEAESSLWAGKTYRLHCSPHRFTYAIEVRGEGRLCEANYFGGYYSGQVRWGSGFFWSGQRFERGFNPEPNSDETNYFPPGEATSIDLMGVPLPGRASWFFTPPPFCYGFQAPGGWLGLGVEAQPGHNRFTQYNYHGGRGAFYLSLAYEGHTPVQGSYRLPAIGFDFAPGEYDALAAHVQALQDAGGAHRPVERTRPAWWYEPIFCGWGEQCYAAGKDGKAPDQSSQALYDRALEVLGSHCLSPGIVVLDDKWQATYGENCADQRKWPDLRGFVRAQHAQGRKVLLWLKAWDPEGLPAEECITNAGGLPLAADPSNPAFEARLRASVNQMVSADGYNADGFKIDFTARIPSGPGLRLSGDVWGLELMKRYLEIVYEQAKQVKPDALVMTHTPHPYLSGVLDMIRLNDINTGKDVNQAMRHRARVAAIACPNAIIDTDNWPLKDTATWRKYLRLQPELGVPSLYYASHIDPAGQPLQERDYSLLRSVWSRYRVRMAALTGAGASAPGGQKKPPFQWPHWRVAARRRMAG